MSKDLRDFNRTHHEAELFTQQAKVKAVNEVKQQQIYTSANHLLISLEKLLNNLDDETIKKNKEHVDNLYYHIGAVKGCT